MNSFALTMLQRTAYYPLLGRATRRLLKAAGRFLALPAQLQVNLNLSARPHYAYCVYHAAELAKRLKLKQVSILEFGVAGGNGLLFLEQFATRVEEALDIEVQLYGFDTGVGLPEITMPEDLPYWFQRSQYRMNPDSLRSATRSATLVLGDVKNTVTDFFAKYQPAPVGAILNDLDLYTSTRDSFALFDQTASHFLPRVFLYFDDIIGTEYEMYTACNGQLLAISDFNSRHSAIHIGLNQNLLVRPDVNYRYQIYYAHLKSHPQYRSYVGAGRQEQIESTLRLSATEPRSELK